MRSVLVVNSGSSSLKLAFFEDQNRLPLYHIKVACKNNFEEELHHQLDAVDLKKISAIGHRVVHGGSLFHKATWIDNAVKKQMEKLTFLAPLHNRINLLGIQVCEKRFPLVKQYAVFDTSFHSTLKPSAFTYPLPEYYNQEVIRRYGFHGISYSYCSKKSAEFLNQPLASLKMVICHLGSGASLCAIKEGRSIDTTMGMTPLEGLMMATRCGSIDPGVILFLMKQRQYSAEVIEQDLNQKSGLLGISGISADMQILEQAALRGHKRAELAIEMFVHRLIKYLGGMIAVLGGIDVLVFTGGIGENASFIRAKTCEQFAYLGLKLDDQKNRSPSQDQREISSQQSTTRILVTPTHEEWQIAQEYFNRNI